VFGGVAVFSWFANLLAAVQRSRRRCEMLLLLLTLNQSSVLNLV